MNPAFSVILFTTVSGLGFGLCCWVGLDYALHGPNDNEFGSTVRLMALLIGGLLVSSGLFASFWHLGKPLRAWRAFSQWRSSWLSREGVCAMLSFVPMGVLVLIDEQTASPWTVRIAGLALSLLSLATVYCTAMIYASLKTVPAWRHRLVVPGYLLFALVSGFFALLPWGGIPGAFELIWRFHIPLPYGFVAGTELLLPLAALWWLKHRYWRDIDRDDGLPTRGDAVGLSGRDVRTFERPATEATYLQREMGFVLARRHARKLRRIAVLLFAVVPAVCALIVVLWWHSPHVMLMTFAMLSLLFGAIVERWLFFAEARHVVTLYD